MNLSLSDLAPPLRWTSPVQIAPIVEEPQLPEAWWQTIPLDRACAVITTQTVAGHLADLAVACWGHLLIGDILPLLRFSDPAEAERTPEMLGKDVVQKLFSGVFERLLDYTIDQQPYLQGFLPVLYLYLYKLSGGLLFPSETNTGLLFVTKDNVGTYQSTQTRYEGSSTDVKLVERSGAIAHP